MKKILIFFYVFFFLFTSITLIVTLNDDLRVKSFSGLKHYYILHKNYIIKFYLRNNNYAMVSKTLVDQINMSLKFTKNKSTLHESIYDNMTIAFDKVYINENINHLYLPVKKILEIDPDIYMANIWMAQILHATGSQDLEALKYINLAIKISPINSEAYRIAMKIINKNKWLEMADELCNKYNKAIFGGMFHYTHNNIFEGNNSTNMALILGDNNNNNLLYTNYGIQFNKLVNYEFNFLESHDVDNFSIILGILSGVNIFIEEIIFNTTDKAIKYQHNDYSIHLKHGYITSKNNNIIINNPKHDELISFYFKKAIKDVQSINIKMNFTKLNFTNLCF